MAEARERLKAETRVDPGQSRSLPWPGLMETVARNPDIVAGAAFATVTLLGPRSAAKLVLRSAKLVGCTGLATQIIRELGRRNAQKP